MKNKQGLVKKYITDKNGKRTTVWVKIEKPINTQVGGGAKITIDAKMKPWEKIMFSSAMNYANRVLGLGSDVSVSVKPLAKSKAKIAAGEVTLSEKTMKDKKFDLYIDRNLGTVRQMQMLMHEATHIGQISKGKLKTEGLKGVLWNGREAISIKDYNNIFKEGKHKEYYELPWEKEAKANEKKMYEGWRKSNEYKSMKGKDATLDFILDSMY